MTEQPVADLTLRQLQGLRREFKAVLENQARDRELITRVYSKMEAGFAELRSKMEGGFLEMRNDILSLENNLLNRQNEILEIVRRLDDAGFGSAAAE